MVLIGVVIVLASCTKDEKTTTEKIQGKWMLVSDSTITVENGISDQYTYNGTSSDYFEFLSNGICNVTEDGNTTPIPYVLNGNTLTLTVNYNGIKMSIDYSIITFTDNTLVIYYKMIYDRSTYVEDFITLKR
jgi:hypothetical protein